MMIPRKITQMTDCLRMRLPQWTTGLIEHCITLRPPCTIWVLPVPFDPINVKHTLLFYLFANSDIDECSTSPCTYPAVCKNTIGSYACSCPPGYCKNGDTCKGICLFFCHDIRFNSYPAYHDYCRFKSVILVDQITAIGNEICVQKCHLHWNPRKDETWTQCWFAVSPLSATLVQHQSSIKSRCPVYCIIIAGIVWFLQIWHDNYRS